ncbi:MAG: DNA polymerase III subunit beta [Candidatus Brennerbacteria bacterium]
MKIVVLRDNLLSGLAAVERAVGGSVNLPILKNMLISAREGNVTLTATNLELAITHEVSGKVLETGEVTCPFGILNTIVKNVGAERITLERSGRKLILTTDNYEAQIQAQDPKEYPLIPSVAESAKTAVFNASVLADALESVVVATQYTDIRPEISGVLFRFHENGVTFVATDSFRLSEYVLVSKELAVHGMDAIVPLKTTEEVLRIVQGKGKDALVEVTVDVNQVLFKTATTRIISRLVDGRFPEYHAIIPKEVKNEATIGREELMQAIKLTSSFSGRANDITLTVSENKKSLELSSSDATLGENKYHIPLKMKGEKFSAAFNWRYLFDGLKIYNGANVVLGVNTSDRPVVIKDPSATHLTYVVMPIKE